MSCKTAPGLASQKLVCAAIPSAGQINSWINPISSLLQENYVKYRFTGPWTLVQTAREQVRLQSGQIHSLGGSIRSCLADLPKSQELCACSVSAPLGQVVAQALAPATHSMYGAYPWGLAQDREVCNPQVTEHVVGDNHSLARGSAWARTYNSVKHIRGPHLDFTLHKYFCICILISPFFFFKRCM